MLSFAIRKVRFSSITIFLFCLFSSFPLFAEDDNSLNQTENSTSEIATASVPESTEDAEIADGETSNDSDSKKQKFNTITFVGNILDDKYPFRVDFGAEPHRHGSMIFVGVDYDWSSIFSQRIRFEYDHYTTSENSNTGLSTEEVRSFSITQFPLVFFLGDSNIKAKTRFTQINIGLYFSYSVTKSNTGSFFNFSNDEEWGEYAGKSGFFINDVEQRYRLIGPAFGYSVNFPIHKYFSASLEGFIVPAYLLTLTTESKTSYYFGDAPTTTSNSVDFRVLSYPIARQTLSLDMFRYLRLKGQVSYQHLDLRSIKIDNTDITNYSVHTLTVRYGGEILKPAKTRKKSAHLWGGLYYEMTWTKNYLADLSVTEYSGKWVLCFAK